MSKIKKGNLSIDSVLVDFIEKEAIPETDINIENFWKEFDEAVHELAPINKQLLGKRDSIQKQIDEWHLSNKGKEINKEEYFKFLKSINYIVEEKEDFKISTANVDDEIAQIAGPQLVVPIDNARYALNAANARWGSL
ncbi:MAG: malate synthase G, partial [Pelagibacteraceae bacterium]